MRDVKRYGLLTILIVTACMIKFHHFDRGFETVEKFRGANLAKEDWYPLIADTVNEKKLTVALDHKEYTNQDTTIFMDENLNIMVPIDILRDGLQCSSHLYDNKNLLIEKRDHVVRLSLKKQEIKVNDEGRFLYSPMIKKKWKYYVSIG